MPKREATADPQVFRYPDGTYYVRDGFRERSLRTKDFTKALKEKIKVLAKLDITGELSGRLRVGDLWPDYVEFRRQTLESESPLEPDDGKVKRRRRTISKNTFREIESVWKNQLRPYWFGLRIDKCDEARWIDFTHQATAIDLANPRKVFSGFLKWCKTKKFVKYVPDMPIPSVDRRERRVLKPVEIRKLFEHANGSVLLYLSAYLFMGMRRKEIMTLRWPDIHFDEDYLVVRKSMTKIRRGRPLPINSYVKALLLNRRRMQISKKVKSEFVFPNRKTPKRHGDLSGLKTAWRTVMERCGFEPGYITPHDLRATYEAYAHKSTDFTDTQREKFAGAAIDVQKKTYVRFDATDVKGLESVVQVEGLAQILDLKIMGKPRGNDKHEKLH